MVRKNKSGFSLMEIIVVVVILGVLAAFVVPNYQKSLQKATERKAATTLTMVKGALEVYKAKNGEYPTFDMVDTAALNAGLLLDINDVDNSYTYSTPGGGGEGIFEIRATNVQYNCRIHMHELMNTEIHSTGSSTCLACTAAKCSF